MTVSAAELNMRRHRLRRLAEALNIYLGEVGAWRVAQISRRGDVTIALGNQLLSEQKILSLEKMVAEQALTDDNLADDGSVPMM